MPPFQYRPYRDPYVGSMVEVMGRGPAARARAVEAVGNIRAEEARAKGQARGQMIRGVGAAAVEGIENYTTAQADQIWAELLQQRPPIEELPRDPGRVPPGLTRGPVPSGVAPPPIIQRPQADWVPARGAVVPSGLGQPPAARPRLAMPDHSLDSPAAEWPGTLGGLTQGVRQRQAVFGGRPTSRRLEDIMLPAPERAAGSFESIIQAQAVKYNVSPDLIRQVIQAESAGDPNAIGPSIKGRTDRAHGLMQLMPATARELGVEDIYDPEQNITGGTKYLRQLLDRFNGDEELAVAAYVWGPGNVSKHLEAGKGLAEMPGEVRQHVAKVRTSPRTLARGGASALPLGAVQEGVIEERPLVEGNVDLYAQPEVRNPDGSISTVDSIGLNIDGKEYLLPTVTPDGRHFANEAKEAGASDIGKAVGDMAYEEFRRTGRHLGIFRSPAASTAYAKKLHEDYQRGKYQVRPVAPEIALDQVDTTGQLPPAAPVTTLPPGEAVRRAPTPAPAPDTLGALLGGSGEVPREVRQAQRPMGAPQPQERRRYVYVTNDGRVDIRLMDQALADRGVGPAQRRRLLTEAETRNATVTAFNRENETLKRQEDRRRRDENMIALWEGREEPPTQAEYMAAFGPEEGAKLFKTMMEGVNAYLEMQKTQFANFKEQLPLLLAGLDTVPTEQQEPIFQELINTGIAEGGLSPEVKKLTLPMARAFVMTLGEGQDWGQSSDKLVDGVADASLMQNQANGRFSIEDASGRRHVISSTRVTTRGTPKDINALDRWRDARRVEAQRMLSASRRGIKTADLMLMIATQNRQSEEEDLGLPILPTENVDRLDDAWLQQRYADIDRSYQIQRDRLGADSRPKPQAAAAPSGRWVASWLDLETGQPAKVYFDTRKDAESLVSDMEAEALHLDLEPMKITITQQRIARGAL
jgi:soluble lytic murein transglycosylase-like protein